MSEVMDQAVIGMPYEMALGCEVSRRQYYSRANAVLAERDALAAEAQALREEVAALRMARDDFKLERDLARQNFCDEQAANYQLQAHLKSCISELSELRARVAVVPDPVTMDGTTTIREYVANAVPKDTPMDKWTQGYEECKRRIHAMFEQPCNKRLNGLTVSEGLLRRLLDSDGIDGIFDAQQNYAAHQELRALLSEQEGGKT
ncbi:hypothetical protein DZ952_001290 [Pseudomonas aeruginosa]|uniref:hypothetical protein n=1 Tax=Pseudomonas aeruginosa TaxID=287 RepID=UPI000E315D8E|nr:hypothetical protein [Pseudomonas aeruginosa]NPZ46283.1 hypothetical protein [Pseudomonas aeruginosa]